MFQWAAESNRTLRNDYLKLKQPFRKTPPAQNSLYFLGRSKWNKLPEFTKKCNNAFAHEQSQRNFHIKERHFSKRREETFRKKEVCFSYSSETID